MSYGGIIITMQGATRIVQAVDDLPKYENISLPLAIGFNSPKAPNTDGSIITKVSSINDVRNLLLQAIYG